MIGKFPWCMQLSGLPWSVILWTTCGVDGHGSFWKLQPTWDSFLWCRHFWTSRSERVILVWISYSVQININRFSGIFFSREFPFCGKFHDFGLENQNLQWITVPIVLPSLTGYECSLFIRWSYSFTTTKFKSVRYFCTVITETCLKTDICKHLLGMSSFCIAASLMSVSCV